MKLVKVKGSFRIKNLNTYNREIRRKLPIKLAVQTERHFREGFEKGGGQTDESRGGWLPRKKGERGGRRGILIKSGTLRRDVKQRSARFDKIEVGTSNITIDYADVHNRGLRSGRGKGFKMPKREFVGKSRQLELQNIRMIKRELKDMLI